MKVKAIVSAVHTAEHFVDILQKQEVKAENQLRDMLRNGFNTGDPQVKALETAYYDAKYAREELQRCCEEFLELDFGGIAHE